MRPAVSAAHLLLPATGYGEQRAKRPPIHKRTLIEAQTTDKFTLTQNQQSDGIFESLRYNMTTIKPRNTIKPRQNQENRLRKSATRPQD